MTEGYIIENRQNEYLDKHCIDFTKDLFSAKIFSSHRDAESCCPASGQVVEILLARRKDFLSKVFKTTREVLVEEIRRKANYGRGPTGQLGYIVSFDLLNEIETGIANEI